MFFTEKNKSSENGANMKKRIGLVSDYIKIKRMASEESTFGGDQNFFAATQRIKNLIYEEKDSAEATVRDMKREADDKKSAEKEEQKVLREAEKKQKMGCGIVALSDIFLYLSGKYNQGVQIGDRSYVNHGLKQKEYCEFYDKIYAFAGGVSLKNGVSGIKLWRKFNRMARRQGWKERARWGFSRKKIFQRMEEILLKDIPVILCMPMALFKKEKDKGVRFYQKNQKGEYVPYTRVNGHYVVVTELLYEEDEIYLVISSWGKQYFIKWKEYDEEIRSRLFGAILGNLLYIK